MRKLLFFSLTLVVALAAIEVAAFILLSLSTERLASPSLLSAQRVALLETEGVDPLADARLQVLHPYLGYSLDADMNKPTRTSFFKGQPISEWGLIDSAPPIRKRGDDRLIVGVFGGSVAYWFSVEALDALIDEMNSIEAFAGRKVEIVRVTIGGYKQPQQLIALSYLLSMGAEFDIVLNIDGFNEIALPPAGSIPYGVFPFYPRNWQLLSTAIPTYRELERMGALATLRERRMKRASIAEARPLRWSMIANLLWWLQDRSSQQTLTSLQLELAESRGEEGAHDFRTHGPPRPYSSKQAIYEDLARSWRDASLQMHHLAKANGALYLHFLQPNQYLPDSKPMDSKETAIAMSPDSPYSEHVAAGYPYLTASGRDLVDAGVNFHDLSQLFYEEKRAVYSDDCCHFNDLGNALLGREVGQRVAQAASNRTALKP